MELKRTNSVMQIRKRMLILCEDEKSSLLYLKAFKTDEEYKRKLSAVMVEVYHPKNHSPVGLMHEAVNMRIQAKKERNPYDEIWIVLDKDHHANLKNALNEAKKKKINYALSNICFELWLLLHFTKTKKHYKFCDELIRELRKYYTSYSKRKCCFDDLRDKMQTAIENAEWLEKQNRKDIDRGVHVADLSAYTNVHQLVKRLINPDN
jgi:hypothetical protein